MPRQRLCCGRVGAAWCPLLLDLDELRVPRRLDPGCPVGRGRRRHGRGYADEPRGHGPRCRRSWVGDQIAPSRFVEDADVRVMSPTRKIDGPADANGYGSSKWGGEVLLREANDPCGLPVAVFRCAWILAVTI